MLKEKVNRNSFTNGVLNIRIPLQSSFACDMGKERMTADHFEKLKSELLPGVVDMEKVVLHPAVFKLDGSDVILKEAVEIQLNFHFRKRMGGGFKDVLEGWTTDDSFGWNGTFYDPASKNNSTEKYNDAEMPIRGQSDLVGFLGFTNDDIKYQRNRVKQSFARLLYYDTDDIINKTLLTYSTSFIDSGKLYSKFSLMRNNKDFISYPNGRSSLVDENATRFSFTCFEPFKVDEKYRDLRLSSGVVLRNKMDDTASSDGFYLYMFKTDAPSTTPKDLFLKVEFNNAGYGKTLSMVFPNRRSGNGDSIIYEHHDNYIIPVEFDGTTETGEKFDYEKWHNDTYLPVKCKYDATARKYFYYFPWNDDIVNDFENGRIVLDFYEPKLNRTGPNPDVKFRFTETGGIIPAERTSVTVNFECENSVIVGFEKGGDSFAVTQQEISRTETTALYSYTLTFPANKNGDYETLAKNYRLTVYGTSGSTSGSCSDTFYITHEGNVCSPSVRWFYPKKNVICDDTSVTLPYSAFCADTDIAPTLTSSNSRFIITSAGFGAAMVTFPKNTSTTRSETTTLTVVVKKIVNGRELRATSTMQLEQHKVGVKPGNISLYDNTTVSASGGTVVLTARTEYLRNIDVVLSVGGGFTKTVDQGTSSLEEANGVSYITLVFDPISDEGGGSTTGFRMFVKKDGYTDKEIYIDCNGPERTDVCLGVSSREISVYATGIDQAGTSVESNTITITQL